MTETFMLGIAGSIITLLVLFLQGILFLWIRAHIAKTNLTAESINSLVTLLSDYKLIVSDKYMSKSDFKEFNERNDQTLKEIRSYLMAIHEK